MAHQETPRWERAQKVIDDGAAIRERARETRAWSRNVRWVVVLQRALRQKLAERRRRAS